jgi:hypothetical protein
MNILPNVLRRVVLVCPLVLLSACHCLPRPGSCARSGVQTLDTEDDFAPPGSRPVQSPALVSYIAKTPTRDEQGFDDARRYGAEFGASFRLEGRRLCSVQVEVRARNHAVGGFNNDWIVIGGAPFDSTSSAPVFHRGPVWPTGSATPRTISINLPVGAVQTYIDTADDPMIDVYIHDDTNIDFIRVTHTYN